MELPKRKQLRLNNYDYSQCGRYFVTICTHNRERVFGCISAGEPFNAPLMRLSPCGEIAHKCISAMPGIEKYVIMPNHIHMIISISDSSPDSYRIRLSSLIRSFKTLVTKACGRSVWQRSYYDRIIRDDNEFLEIWKYIDGNPSKWLEDEYYN